MPVFPFGRRIDDPPPDEQVLEWRMRLAARKYPIQVALFVAVAILSYPVSLLIGAQNDLREDQEALSHALEQSGETRQIVVTAICGELNDQDIPIDCSPLIARIECVIRQADPDVPREDCTKP